MKAPERLTTQRLILRRPAPADAPAIFERYASGVETTRWLSWARHLNVEQTQAFIEASDEQWRRWPAGPYLIETRAGLLVGGTGLAFETPQQAQVGYVLALDAWGRGYATETLRAVSHLAAGLGVRRLYALCHPQHRASAHVLEKCGFAREGSVRGHCELPNLIPGECVDALCYALLF